MQSFAFIHRGKRIRTQNIVYIDKIRKSSGSVRYIFRITIIRDFYLRIESRESIFLLIVYYLNLF